MMAGVKTMEWRGTACCPGSCGELVQGTWNGVNFLVPSPVNLYSVAQVTLRPNTELTGSPKQVKALEAVRKTLSFLGNPDLGGELCLDSQIPWGKGMASSTADIGAAIAATASALGISLSPRDLAALAISIEPTDGTLFPGITLVDHVKGYWRLPLGKGPAAEILVADLGGEVDTLEFNARPELPERNRANEAQTRKAFYLVRRGIQEKSLSLLAQGASMSAEANQVILPKPLLREIREWSLTRGCAGVIAAHSGTVLGLIYPSGRELKQEEDSLHKAFPGVGESWRVQLIEGGVKVVKPDVRSWRELVGGEGKVRKLGVPGF